MAARVDQASRPRARRSQRTGDPPTDLSMRASLLRALRRKVNESEEGEEGNEGSDDQSGDDGKEYQEAVAETLVDLAWNGHVAAIRLIFERIDGKVADEVKQSGYLEIRYVNDWRRPGGPAGQGAPDK